MADELAWRDVGLGLVGIVTTVVSVLYRGITTRLNKHGVKIETVEAKNVALDRELALVKQQSIGQHQQLMAQVAATAQEQRGWHEDGKEWRAGVARDIASIHARFVTYDQDIAAFYRDNSQFRQLDKDK